MDEAMVTGRMTKSKKDAGNAVLARAGIKPSQAINRLYDLLIEKQDASFLQIRPEAPTRDAWKKASQEIDALVLPWTIDERFGRMSNKQVAVERLKAKGAI